MKSFKQFVLLSESKNTHLEHLEDELWNDGETGVENALKFIESVGGMLEGNTNSSVNLTVKWDGAPAVFCGIDPESKKFFVGTKSIFNKNPKLNFTPKDIDENHGHAPQLAAKLKVALKNLPKLGIKGILQGDLMFTSGDLVDSKIDGEEYVTFTPNTITYAFPKGSDSAKQIKAAKLGVVFHTKYTGRSMDKMKASFTPNIKRLKKTKDVWFKNADYKDESGSSLMTSAESDNLKSAISDARKHLSDASGAIEEIRSNTNLISNIKIYVNTLIKAGSSDGSVSGLSQYVETKFDTAIGKLTSEKGKENKTLAKEEFLAYINKNEKNLEAMFKLHSILTKIKVLLIRKLESIKGVGTFIKTDDGFRPTSPEGFVAVDKLSNKAVKLVDRLEFSRANFTVAKNWTKG